MSSSTPSAPASRQQPASEQSQVEQRQRDPYPRHRQPQIRAGALLGSRSIVVAASGRKRASKPKVRTGCVTCKSRHVRCDERKPLCLRCEKARMECAGYAPVPATTTHQSRTATARHNRSLDKACPPLQVIRPALVPSCFADKDITYFDFFRHSLAADLSGYLHGDFWCRVVLSESTRDACVQHGILALGALSRALYSGNGPPAVLATGSSPSPLHPHISDVVNEHHSAAIHHQNQAISLCLKRIQEGPKAMTPRALLIITLLLVAYEFLQGNMQGADGLLETGVGLLRDTLPILRETGTSRRPSRIAADDEMREMDHILPYLSVMSGYTGFCNSQHRLYERPISFPDEDPPLPGSTSPTRLLSAWGRFYTRAIIFHVQATRALFGRASGDLGKTQEEQERCLELLRRWREVVMDCRDRFVSSRDARTRRAMRLVHMQYLTILIAVSCCRDKTDMLYDRYEAEFREMLRLCSECLAEPEPVSKIRFTFEGGSIASPLFIILCKCRRRDLRMKAVAACQKVSWREGAWDGKALLCGLGLAMLEEQYRDESGHIPASARFVWKDVKWDQQHRQLVAEYWKLRPEKDGTIVSRQLTLDVDRWTTEAFGDTGEQTS